MIFFKSRGLIIVFSMVLISLLLSSNIQLTVNQTSSVVAEAETTENNPPKRIILIGWDGVQRNHLNELLEDPNELPVLRALCSEGKYVEMEVTSGNTATKAGWTQILTGYDPEITGVYSNKKFQAIPQGYTIFERLNKHYGKENIFSIMVTGKASHIGSKEGFPYYNAKKSIDKYELDTERDAVDVWPLAKKHLDDYYINHIDEHLFAFIHFREPDHNGHYYGENHENYNKDLRTIDSYSGKIINWLKTKDLYNDTFVYITSDHGYDEASAPFPVVPDKPGFGHHMAPYTFLGTNNPKVIRNGDRKDVTPTILKEFGLNLSQIKPALSGTPLTVKKRPITETDKTIISKPIKKLLVISWSGVQKNHLEEMLNENNTLPNLQNLIEHGRFVEISSTHLQSSLVESDMNLYGTDSTCGLSSILTGYDPDLTSIFNDYRYGTIPKGYTIFERLKEYYGKENVTNLMVTGLDKETGGGKVPYQNAVSYVDYFNVNIPQNNVGQKILNYLENISTEYYFGIFHFSKPDHAGHTFGEYSKEYDNAIKNCDTWLGKIINKLESLNLLEDTLLYVTSTHGFDETNISFPYHPENPGRNHTMAPYMFLATNDLAVIRHGNQRDFAPTILTRFGIDLNGYQPTLPGKILIAKKINNIIVPVIDANQTMGNYPLMVRFKGEANKIDGDFLSYTWDFGDENTANVKEVEHTYYNPGVYIVTLNVTDDQGSSGISNIIINVNHPPTVQIKSNITEGNPPLMVSFTSFASDIDGDIISYHWDFDDDSTSNTQNPIHIFENPGNFTVRLKVVDNNIAVARDIIVIRVNHPPKVSIIINKTIGMVPLYIEFCGNAYDQDGIIISYHWDFGDGSTSDQKNPSHIYYQRDQYDVRLTILDNMNAIAIDEVAVSVGVIQHQKWNIIIGPILDQHGLPICGVEIILTNQNHGSKSSITQEDGYVDFYDVLPGDYMCIINLDNSLINFSIELNEYGYLNYGTIKLQNKQPNDDPNKYQQDVIVNDDNEVKVDSNNKHSFQFFGILIILLIMILLIFLTKKYNNLSR